MSEQNSAQNCRGQFENEAPLISFTPVAVRPRHDRRKVERQITFIENLAGCGSVSAACNAGVPARVHAPARALRAQL